MDTKLNDLPDKDAYRRRLRMLRVLHNMSRKEWEAFTGISYKKWYHYESGFPVSRESLFTLRKVINLFKLSSDWLYWGDIEALSPGLLAQFREVEKQMDMLHKKLSERNLRQSKPIPMTPVKRTVRRKQKQKQHS